MLDPAHATGVNPGGNGIFNPIVVIGGRVRGSWRRTIKRDRVEIAATPFARVHAARAARDRARGRALRRLPGPPVVVT